MRVLLAHNHYTVHGGAEVFFREVGRLLSDNGHDVAYFTPQEDNIDTPYSEYFPQAADYKVDGVLNKIRQIPSMIYNNKARDNFAGLIEDFKPDVIHVFAIYIRLTPSILDAARDANVPIVMSCNDYKHICPNYKLYYNGKICEECKGGRFHRALINRCCHDSTSVSAASMIEAYTHNWLDIWKKNVSIFLFASQFMANKTLEFWGEDSITVDYLPNPFDADQHFIACDVGKYYLYFGRLIDEKGVNILLDAAQMAPEQEIVIIGDGPEREVLEGRADNLDNVRMVGPAWGHELTKWLQGARAVVVPSLWHENYPYVIFQSFAASLPVIGSRRGGIPELVQAGPHGWLYDATDAQALADIMRMVSKTPDAELQRMGKATREYVANEFSDAVIYERLIKIYQRANS